MLLDKPTFVISQENFTEEGASDLMLSWDDAERNPQGVLLHICPECRLGNFSCIHEPTSECILNTIPIGASMEYFQRPKHVPLIRRIYNALILRKRQERKKTTEELIEEAKWHDKTTH
jgi:hypothetical protein